MEEWKQMKRNNWGLGLLVLTLAVTLPLGGCSKKVAAVDPTKDPQTQGGANNGGGSGTPSDANPTTDPTSIEGKTAAQLGIEDVFFDYDDATLSATARDILSANASHLNELTSLGLLIEGHCDERGTVEYNLALGQRRADATKGYLVNLGVSGSRLNTRSMGEERPFAQGGDESAWSQNRRAHFVVQNSK